ncbi:MAG: CDP-glycerol glycerophosphotransferase family protein [Lactobacillaceae bacterium]|jgi:CDP-glycerol glycerophosphotransferase (TagB/SpsB family)|nr:CDP-glycerol glycerophosphotransferase family protein [Lactobacillaceae bacterium]
MKINEFEKYYQKKYTKGSIDEHLAIYETRDGQGFGDSPKAILDYWVANLPEYEHIIVVKAADIAFLTAEYATFDNVTVVEYLSKAHADGMLTAKYVITNALIFTSYFTKKTGQIFVNTWHGTPVKKMGYAMPGGVMGSWNVVRNFVMTDYLLAPNEHTETIFRRDYRLDGIYDGTILRMGYPRNDVLINGLDADKTTKIRTTLGLNPAQPFVLYAPTWTGDNATLSLQSKVFTDYLKVINKTIELGFQIRLKVHPYLWELAQQDQAIAPYLIADTVETNEVLGLADQLITDYSSIFFDYLILNRPITFLDLTEDYDHERGLYIPQTDLPGTYLREVEQLDDGLQHDIFQDRRLAWQKQFTSEETGQSAKAVVEQLLAHQPVSKAAHTKPRVLINARYFLDSQVSNKIIEYIQAHQANEDISVIVSFPGSEPEFWQHVDAIIPPNSIDPDIYSRLFVHVTNTKWHELRLRGRIKKLRKLHMSFNCLQWRPKSYYELNNLTGGAKFDKLLKYRTFK